MEQLEQGRLSQVPKRFRLSRMFTAALRRPHRAVVRMSALKRLGSVLSSLSPSSAGKDKDGSPGAVLGHLNLGGVSLPVYETQDPERLPRDDLLLDHRDPRVSHMIWWCLQKTILGALLRADLLLGGC